ncbi:MAG TPA: DUF2933 domain-containing protein [Burkholderiales bacterium]|nr:DUF2933 domain-containing protein [Burkholderiales bacterium]
MEHRHSEEQGGWQPKAKWVLIGFLAVGAFFLISEHQAHALGLLPFLILLACPLMHLFMHHGHGSHGGDGERTSGHSDHKPEVRK